MSLGYNHSEMFQEHQLQVQYTEYEYEHQVL